MDISETYIKMCDCEEIQAIKVGFILSSNSWHDEHLVLCTQSEKYYGDYFWVKDNPKRTVWLPRQDQLQEMVWDKLWEYCSNKISSLSWGVWNFYLQADDNYYPDSMEQLWLAFVMKENHNKLWDGADWVTTTYSNI